jgi:hypothetical protein
MLQARFEAFAKKIIKMARVTPEYKQFARKCYKQFGRGAVQIYPMVYTGYDLDKMEEAQLVHSYLPLKDISEIWCPKALIFQVQNYNVKDDYVLSVLPYDEDEPRDDDVDLCIHIII